MDIDGLVELIKHDLNNTGSYDRYPVRFFSMHYEDGTSASILKLQQKIHNTDIFDIQSILAHEDAWLTADKLRKAIYNLPENKSHIVIGFSEYSRFLAQKDFVSLVISLLELENPDSNRKRRIYIPCFALYSQLKKTVNRYHRRMDVYNPFINETNTEDLPRIYFIDSELDAGPSTNEVTNSAEWFGMWRNQDIDTHIPIICTSPTLAYFYEQASPDNVYNIRRIRTYAEMLHSLYSVGTLKPYDKEPEEFNHRLIKDIRTADNSDLGQLILSLVNAQSIGIDNIYVLWKTYDKYERWLIQNYILGNAAPDSYIYKMMTRLEYLTIPEFIDVAYQLIIELKEKELLSERNRLLESIARAEGSIPISDGLTAFFKKLIQEIVRRKTTISIDGIDFARDNDVIYNNCLKLQDSFHEELITFLTCYSKFERQMIIWLYRMNLLNERDLKIIYPRLWEYVDDTEIVTDPDTYAEKLEEYFSVYKKCKLNKNPGSDYLEALDCWNTNEDKFYSWYLTSQIQYPEQILATQAITGNVYVLDGVGGEFIEYIMRYLLHKKCSFVYSGYAKSHIPSITSQARKHYPNNYKWILDYDQKVIHGEFYYPAVNLENALSVIDDLIERIITIEGDNTFAITADHGSTVGHKIIKKDKKYNLEDADHDGRCYNNKSGQTIVPSNDYVLYDDDFSEKWVIALNNQSLCNNSKYAVHGGLTPEEVIVPVIIAKRGKETKTTYKVKPVNLKVSGLKKTVEFKITPVSADVSVSLKAKDGTNTAMVFDPNLKTWSGTLKRGIEQDLEISVGGQTFTFKTIPNTKMGDDLFDE